MSKRKFWLGLCLAVSTIACTQAGIGDSQENQSGFLNEQRLQVVYPKATRVDHQYAELYAMANEGDTKALTSLLQDAKLDNCTEAQYYVGKLYLEGRVVPQRYDLARDYLTQAALNGYWFANVDLAKMHFKLKQYSEAHRWCYAFANSNPDCAYILGWLYEHDVEVVQDLPKAFGYYRFAAKHQHPEAMFKVAYGNLERTTKPLPAMVRLLQHDIETIPEDIQKAADLGSMSARAFIGYQQAYSSDPNQSREGLRLLQQTVNEKNPLGLFLSGMRDIYTWQFDSGLQLLKESLEEDEPWGAWELSKLYFEGNTSSDLHVILRNQQLAVNYLEQAARLGHPYAQETIPSYYFAGKYLPQSDRHALYYLNLAAQRGIMHAYKDLYTYYSTRVGDSQENDLRAREALLSYCVMLKHNRMSDDLCEKQTTRKP